MQPISPWFAKAFILAAIVGFIVVRHPHMQRSFEIKVAAHRRSTLDNVLVAFVAIGFLLLPLIWLFTSLLSFADYPLYPIPFAGGVLCLAGGLWLLHRSHADLGANWSNTLELRETHQLVTAGIYQQVRHPMYLAILLHALGQLLAVPNWIVGPLYFVAFALLVASRLRPEERMMLDKFGQDYESYRARTKRIIPGVW